MKTFLFWHWSGCMTGRRLIAVFLVLISLQCFSVFGQAPLGIVNLRTEYKTNPLGLGTVSPRLSWEVVSTTRGVLQTAYQIKAALTPEDLKSDKKLLWNTGKVISDRSNQIEYNGTKLQSAQKVYWQVKIWDNKGKSTGWSEKAWFETGFLSPSDWKANWIEPQLQEDPKTTNPNPYLRKEFQLKGKPVKARMFITSHGLYQLNINGKKVSDHLFTPGWTSYDKRLQYQVYDVTDQLNAGANAVGVILADGWYRGYVAFSGNRNTYGDKLALLAQLQISYADGTQEMVVTDNSWKTSTGPMLKSDIYNGEIYDARLENNGWDKPGFSDKAWKPVEIRDFNKGILVSTQGPPVRITEIIKPIKKFTTPKGELVFDMGQNMVGWVQFSLKGSAGSKITLKFAEVLDKQGNFYTDNLRSAKATDEYIFKGEGIETFEPHFTFHGFRYLKVENYSGDIAPESITGKVFHSDMTPSGDFICSDSLVNKLQHNIQWGLRGNFVDVPTDCPQRDERLGWTGDAQVFAPTACFNRDAASFYTKWMQDFIADQAPDGGIPYVVPNVLKGGYSATGWADAAIVIPWTVYQVYGDKRILETQYECMKGWIKYMKAHSDPMYLFNSGYHFGDWLAFATNRSDYPGATTDKDLLATAYFAYSTGLMQKIASVLGKTQDANEFSQLQEKIKSGFQKEFMTETGRLSSNTQTAYVLALAFDLIPENLKASAAKRLADDVRNFGHITTGFLGTPLICHVLSDNGYSDLANMLLFRKKYPSWLYPVTMGATTIWERWDGIKPDSTFQDVGMNSFNHYAYGAIGSWLYSRVAGLQSGEPGYKKIIIDPYLSKDMKFAKASYHSIYGDIVSEWKKDGNTLKLHVIIPANTAAQIVLPAAKAEQVKESGNPIAAVKDLSVAGVKEGKVILQAGSGEYNFSIE